MYEKIYATPFAARGGEGRYWRLGVIAAACLVEAAEARHEVVCGGLGRGPAGDELHRVHVPAARPARPQAEASAPRRVRIRRRRRRRGGRIAGIAAAQDG